MRNPEQGPSWFARSLGPLRLTKRTQQDVMAVPAGGIPMARFITLCPGMECLVFPHYAASQNRPRARDDPGGADRQEGLDGVRADPDGAARQAGRVPADSDGAGGAGCERLQPDPDGEGGQGCLPADTHGAPGAVLLPLG